MKISGIYKIQSLIKPERIYIGSAKQMHKRWHSHLSCLRNNVHNNKKLQNHFNKYGESDLCFSVLLGCNIEDLIKTEQYFIDSYNPFFNICKIAGSKLGTKMTDEQRKKISKAHLGLKFSDEHKRRISESNMGKKMKPISEETREKMSAATKGQIRNRGKRWKLTQKQADYRSEFMKSVWEKRKAI